MANTTTVQVSIDVSERLKQLAIARSRKLGLPKTLSQRDFVEMLVNEEEIRGISNE